MPTPPPVAPVPAGNDRILLRLGAIAGIVGLVLQFVLGQLHAGTLPPNDSGAVFREYLESDIWTAVHIGQFAGVLLITLAFIALARVVAREGGIGGTLAAASAVVFLLVTAVFAVQMAVDGIALREAIAAWADAPAPDTAAAFLVAESVRWLEKALSAFFHLLNGTGLLLLGLSIGLGRAWSWVLGVLAAVAGAGFLYGGWITAQTGFSAEAGSVLSTTALVAVAFIVGAAISMIRTSRRTSPVAAERGLGGNAPVPA